MLPQQKQLGIVGSMLQIKQINEMTTQQISDALYGNGLPINDPEFGNFIDGPKTTFSGYIRDSQDTVAGLRKEASSEGISDDLRELINSDAERIESQTKSLQKAYDNHTLNFTKATDIPKLNYSARITASTSNTVRTVGNDEIYDQSVLASYGAQHQNSMWTNYGGAAMVWTW